MTVVGHNGCTGYGINVSELSVHRVSTGQVSLAQGERQAGGPLSQTTESLSPSPVAAELTQEILPRETKD